MEYERADWAYRIAKSIARKFEQTLVNTPDGLTNYLNSESAAGGRIDLKLHDVTPARDLQADYFEYRSNERFFEYVNAEITSKVLSGYYSWRRNERTVPDPDWQCSVWQCQVREVYKREKVLSVKFDYFYYHEGAAHGNSGTDALNFAGEEIGRFELREIFKSDPPSLKYLIEYVQLGLRQQLLATPEEDTSEEDEPPAFLCDFEECIRDPEVGWRLLDVFTFDERGLVIHFDPYDVMAYVYGGFDVRVEWDHIWDRLTDEIRLALGPALGRPHGISASHPRANNK